MSSNENWLSILTTALRQATINQCKGHLVEFNNDGVAEAKCALGVISCETGHKLTPDNEYKYGFSTILLNAGVPSEIVYDDHLASYIYHANDGGKTFSEIADMLDERYGGQS